MSNCMAPLRGRSHGAAYVALLLPAFLNDGADLTETTVGSID